jgi:hypothetical protein
MDSTNILRLLHPLLPTNTPLTTDTDTQLNSMLNTRNLLLQEP